MLKDEERSGVWVIKDRDFPISIHGQGFTINIRQTNFISGTPDIVAIRTRDIPTLVRALTDEYNKNRCTAMNEDYPELERVINADLEEVSAEPSKHHLEIQPEDSALIGTIQAARVFITQLDKQSNALKKIVEGFCKATR